MQMRWVLTPQEQWLVAVCVSVVVIVAAALFVWWLGRRLRRSETRVAQLTAALALLTDTVEAGFQDALRPASREAAPAATRARGNAQRRVRSAAKRGRTVGDIAASEELSEGEVRLMLQMNGVQSDVGHHADVR